MPLVLRGLYAVYAMWQAGIDSSLAPLRRGVGSVPGIRAYARSAGIALLVVAAAGLALFGWDHAAVYYDAGLGLFFLFVGCSRLESTTVRQIVGGFGVLLVAVMGVAILVSWLLLPTRYLHGPIEIACLVVGVANIVAAGHLPDRRGPRRERRVS